ncbi:hypothetical protein EGW08_016119 [Elysia chlorotica]|uniref:Cadherin-like beta-sandwich-like domain-containing protein n=1 Tax=Elysia chlorotica TaxID=188477 RepID=A0A3S1B6G5_ELYCH|nr:hypothetical protein EGW08_016119 [Elysia chlorotica]
MCDVTGSPKEPSCFKDPSRLGELKSIVTHPYLQLYPEFSPLNTDYQVWTDYSNTVVNIRVFPEHCQTRARLAEVDDGNRSSSGNLSLGLGENTVHIKVENTRESRPVTIATYRISIYRRSRDALMERSRDVDLMHRNQMRVCALKQDCALRYLPEEPCGLIPWTKLAKEERGYRSIVTWDQFLASQANIVVLWSVAGALFKLWQLRVLYLEGCRLAPGIVSGSKAFPGPTPAMLQRKAVRLFLHRKRIQKLKSDVSVLFIGDSTNRGILNYITKRLNGSLLQWDKTHTMRVYSALNHGRTVFGFAYYPQFWLDSRSKPSIDVAFAKLRKRAQAVSKQSETVLVVGGVHWLTSRHVQALQARLDREGLKNVTVVVKGLGAGFHQPVTGVYQLSLADQRKMYSSNKELLSYSRSQGLHTVDTFSMTMARFRDFGQGKCACHFHRVSADRPSVLEKLSLRTSSAHVPSAHAQYSVHGEINAAYSEMVINRICLGHDQ